MISVSHFGSFRLVNGIGEASSIERGDFAGQAVKEARTLHVRDLKIAAAEFPGAEGGDYTHEGERTGLRLTLAKKFVELHGGNIWAESKLGKGSRFTFSLPMEQ